MSISVGSKFSRSNVMATSRKSGATSSIATLYMRTLLLVAPIASYLIIPVQGATPANVLLFLSLVVPFFGLRYQVKFLISIGLFCVLYGLYLILSLSSYSISSPDLSEIIEIRRIFLAEPLRQTHITQGIYLLTSMIFLYHVCANYSKISLDYAYYGIIILIIYGLYQFAFHAVFGFSGDFITNRDFSENKIIGNSGQGVVQASQIFGPPFIRFYSLTGEPSFFALTATPFFIFAYAMRAKKLAGFIFLALFLSTSSTAILGIGVGMFVLYYRDSRYVLFGVPLVFMSAIVAYATVEPFQLLLDRLIFQKLGSESGQIRTDSMVNHLAVVLDGNPLRLLFGLGFGTVRSADMLTTLLANTGVIGFLSYSAAMLLPAFFLNGHHLRVPIQAVLWSNWAIAMFSVSEYSYLPPWFFTGMAYSLAFWPNNVRRRRILST